jgi:Homeodomain-like domain
MLYWSLAPGGSLDQGAVFEKIRSGVLSWPRRSQVDVELSTPNHEFVPGFRSLSPLLISSLLKGRWAEKSRDLADRSRSAASDSPRRSTRLQRITRLRTAPHAEVVRAKILVLAYEHPDWTNTAIARAVGCTDRTVRKWRDRSRAGPALKEAPRPGGPRFFPLRGPRASDRPRLHAAPGFR